MKSFREYLIPSIIAAVLMSAYAIVDGIFIGYRLNDAGLAAINLAWPITAFLQGLGLAMGISGGIYLTRLKAQGQEERIPLVKGSILILLFLTSFLLGGLFYSIRKPLLSLYQAEEATYFMSIEYISIILYGSVFQMLGCALIPLLKNSGKVRLAMISSIAATVSNLILDYFMIFEWNMGLKGAAIASVLAQAISFLISFIPYIRECKGIKLDKELVREVILGSPAPFILNYSYSLLIILTNLLCERYGGDAAVASYTVLSYMLWVVNAASQGSGDAIQPLFSYSAERGEWKKNDIYLAKCITVSFVLIFIFCILFYLLRNPIGYLYGLSEAAMKIFTSGLRFYLIGFLFIAIHKVICSYMYSINHKLIANALVLLEPLIFTPIAYWIFISILGMDGLWIAFMAVQILLMAFVAVLYFVFRRKDHERIINC